MLQAGQGHCRLSVHIDHFPSSSGPDSRLIAHLRSRSLSGGVGCKDDLAAPLPTPQEPKHGPSPSVTSARQKATAQKGFSEDPR